MTIKFYGSKNKYECFSNFSNHPIELDSKDWPTSEHYFQACKFDDEKVRDSIRLADSPTKAKRMGNSKKYVLRSDWENIKDDIMRKVVLAKFTQHKDIQETLLSTGDEEIVENSPSDYYWGIGKDGNGKNMLGKILMEVRKILNDAEYSIEDWHGLTIRCKVIDLGKELKRWPSLKKVTKYE